MVRVWHEARQVESEAGKDRLVKGGLIRQQAQAVLEDIQHQRRRKIKRTSRTGKKFRTGRTVRTVRQRANTTGGTGMK
jgi:cell division FtsZ-interacting protein ZapD